MLMATATELIARMCANILNEMKSSLGSIYSGTAAGSQFGVAKAANLVAVKVLSDAG